MPVQKRLPPDQRRTVLLDAAEPLFAGHPFHDVQMDDVARSAGVSRALLYRHFSSKRELFAALYRRAADRLLEITVLDPSLPLHEQVAAGLDAHIDYFVVHRSTVLAANRDLAGDPTIQAVIADELSVLRDRMLDVGALQASDRATVAAIMMSWLVFVRVLSVEWLESEPCSREVLRDTCVGALLGALAPVVATDR